MSALDAAGAFALARVDVVRFRLPLRRPLDSARGRLLERDGVLLAVVDADGVTGFGEATPFPGFHGARGAPDETAPACARALVRAIGPGAARCQAEEWISRGAAALDGRPVATAALESALCDLAARRAGVPVASLLVEPGSVSRTRVPVSALVSAVDPRDVERDARAARDAGFAAVKLKLLGDAGDRARVRAARAGAGPRMALRVDAGGGWSEDEALRAMETLAPFDIDYVEQPIAPGRPDALARLRRRAPFAVAADEDATCAESVSRLVEADAVDWLVLKPSACGGPRTAARLARQASAAGIGVVVTSLLDGAIGRAAALHVAAALTPAPPPCGLATGSWLARDLAALPAPAGGVQALPAGPGLGIAPDPGAAVAFAARASEGAPGAGGVAWP